MTTFRSTVDTGPTITVADAESLVIARVSTVGNESVPLAAARGRVLREDVVAAFDVPFTDNSAMDGYAVRAADVAAASAESPVRLRVTGEIVAESAGTPALVEGCAVRVMTGGAIPAGADAVVPVELTDAGSDVVTVHGSVPEGANIRRAGEDMRAGSTVLRRGAVIDAGAIGVLATLRMPLVTVARKPRVAILATGNELTDIAEPAAPGTVANANAYALAALVDEAGGIAEMRGIVADSHDATVEAITRAAADCDFVVTTGGVSAGAHDHVHDALTAAGAEIHFWRVAMRPGKPALFATVAGRPFFGLPGNPVSAFVGFVLFVAPAIRKAADATGETRSPVIRVVMDEPIAGSRGMTSYVRVRVSTRDGRLFARSTGAQGSHRASSLAGANGLAIVDPSRSVVEAGEEIPAVLIGLPFNG